MLRAPLLALTLVASLSSGGAALAHDPSAYGGLFRSRNFGATWLNADVGLFLGGAVALAIDPADPSHLILGTDSGLLVSHNGGRKWDKEAPATLFGSVFAVSMTSGGETVVCATPGGVFRREGGQWRQATAPAEAAPARALVRGAAPGRMYLIGRRDLFASDDAGRSWRKVGHDIPDQPEFTELAIATQPAETLYAIADGKLMASSDGGVHWQLRQAGIQAETVEGLSLDPAVASRIYLAGGGHVWVSDDGGARWRELGELPPDQALSVRAIVADRPANILVAATHKGLYRSANGGKHWALLEDNLPVHLEARPLMQDLSTPGTIYAGYALMPYTELWRIALEGGSLLGRVDPVSLAGGLAFLILLGLAGFAAARRLARPGAKRSPSTRKGHE